MNDKKCVRGYRGSVIEERLGLWIHSPAFEDFVLNGTLLPNNEAFTSVISSSERDVRLALP